LVNDYYLNLLHWGSNNVLGVALGPTVYLWHPDTGAVDSAMSLEDSDSYISSIQWSPKANLLAVGTTLNSAYIYDAQRECILRELEGHSNRIAALSWQNNNIVTTGGRDSAIMNHDLRMRRSVINSYTGHTQEVCGLAWSSDEQTLVNIISIPSK
jgi:cell division cycle 20, cofactor of APC complex